MSEESPGEPRCVEVEVPPGVDTTSARYAARLLGESPAVLTALASAVGDSDAATMTSALHRTTSSGTPKTVLVLIEDEDVALAYTDDPEGRAASEADLAWMFGEPPDRRSRHRVHTLVPRSTPYYVNRVVLPNAPLALSPLPVGWVEPVRQALWDLRDISHGFRLLGLGTKVGALRIHVDPASVPEVDRERVREFTQVAAADSMQICDLCGQRGSLIEDGWSRTRCEEHQDAEPEYAVVEWNGE